MGVATQISDRCLLSGFGLKYSCVSTLNSPRENFNPGQLACQSDGHDIKPDFDIFGALLVQIILGGEFKVPLFGGVDGSLRWAEDFAAAQFNLDEDQSITMPGNKINLPIRGSIVAGQDAVTMLFKHVGRPGLPLPYQEDGALDS